MWAAGGERSGTHAERIEPVDAYEKATPDSVEWPRLSSPRCRLRANSTRIRPIVCAATVTHSEVSATL